MTNQQLQKAGYHDAITAALENCGWCSSVVGSVSLNCSFLQSGSTFFDDSGLYSVLSGGLLTA